MAGKQINLKPGETVALVGETAGVMTNTGNKRATFLVDANQEVRIVLPKELAILLAEEGYEVSDSTCTDATGRRCSIKAAVEKVFLR